MLFSTPHPLQFFEGLEGAPLGIITLEDVLEELIGEEIFDEYDPPSETGQPSLPASSYVPAEAQEAAEAAAKRREKELSVGFVDKEEETAPPKRTSTPIARRLPKLSVPRFPGKRTSSTPGAKRTGEFVKMPEVGGGHQHEKVLEGEGDYPLTAEPTQLCRSRSEDDVSREVTEYQRRSKGTAVVSQSAPTTRPASTDAIRQAAGLGSTPETEASTPPPPPPPPPPPTASAVPARLLPGSVPFPSGVGGLSGGIPEGMIPAPSGMPSTTTIALPTSNGAPIPATLPTPLSEALLVERGRRRLAAVGGHPSSVLMNPAGPMRPPSRSSSVGPGSKAGGLGTGRISTPTGMMVAAGAVNGTSQSPTPGVHGSAHAVTAAVSSSATNGTTESAVSVAMPSTVLGQGTILCPIPKRTPRFKSVPAAAGGATPASTTPVEDEQTGSRGQTG